MEAQPAEFTSPPPPSSPSKSSTTQHALGSERQENPQWSYMHLSLPSDFLPLNESAIKRLIQGALRSFAGEVGAASIHCDVLDVDVETRDVLVRVPRSDTRLFWAAITTLSQVGQRRARIIVKKVTAHPALLSDDTQSFGSEMLSLLRRYDNLVTLCHNECGSSPSSPSAWHDRMEWTVDMLWRALRASGVSWIGFYSFESDPVLHGGSEGGGGGGDASSVQPRAGVGIGDAHSTTTTAASPADTSLPTPPTGSLVLGPSRDSPACSPIGLHGACGQAWVARQPLVVSDVRRLGDGYIACDPRDRAEVIIPLCVAAESYQLVVQSAAPPNPLPASKTVWWGVLDVDSHSAHAFDQADVRGLMDTMVAAHLTIPYEWTTTVV